MTIYEKLLKYYEEKLEEAKDLYDYEFFDFIYKAYIDSGICYCAFQVFGEEVDSKTTSPFKSYGAYWAKAPMHAETKSGAVELIRVRINNLKIIVSDGRSNSQPAM